MTARTKKASHQARRYHGGEGTYDKKELDNGRPHRRSASRLRFRFGQVKLNNHSSFGVRRLVAAMAPPSKGKRRQVAALHSALVICPSFARILTRTFNCTPILAL